MPPLAKIGDDTLALTDQLAAKDAEIAGLKNQVAELRNDCGMPTCGPGLRETIEEWKAELATAADKLKLAEDALAGVTREHIAASHFDTETMETTWAVPCDCECCTALAAIRGSIQS